ncbi:MAG: hypothetical protein PHN22_05010 [Candidatus ainarchaeum sp.]|nr:hypothetical protein [Candidatus ainarchaeum sp.]
MELEIEIKASNNLYLFDLFNTKKLQPNVLYSVPGDVNLYLKDKIEFKESVSEIIRTIIVDFGVGFSAGLFANYLYNKFKKNNISKIKINNMTVIVTNENLLNELKKYQK